MTNDEKIRLVLETLGVDNVRQASRAIRELNDGLDKTGQAATQAAGKSGVNGTGILQLAYFIDDMQYGVRGVMNNIPILAQSLGLGAGLAGMAGIAAVAVGTLVEKHPEWFEWSKKVKESLKEVTDALAAEEAAVKRQKEAVDKLGESSSKRIEDILKLKEATQQLKESEAQLAEDRKNAKAVEEAEKNAGVLADEELARQRGVFKDVITDAGLQGDLLAEIRKSLAGEMQADPKAIFEKQLADIQKEEMARMDAATESGVIYRGMSNDEMRRQAGLRAPRALAAEQNRIEQEIEKSASKIFGGLANPKSLDEINAAFDELSKRVPDAARAMRDLYNADRDTEAFDASNEAWRRGGGARRRAAEREAAEAERRAGAMGPARGLFDDNERKRQFEEQAQSEAELARQAAIRNEVLAQMDPTQMAAMRNAEAGMGPFRNRNLKQLYQRDLEIFANALAERGMAPGDAQQAATESLTDGQAAFQEFARSVGKRLDNGLRAHEASAMYIEMITARQNEADARLEMVNQRLNILGNQQPNVRPQMGRARP